MGEFYHNWMTEAVTNLVFKRLGEETVRPRYRWDALLNPEPVQTNAVASASDQKTRTVAPRKSASKTKAAAKSKGKEATT